MKKFENPQIEIEEMEVLDVITTSNETEEPSNPEGGLGWG